MRAFLELTLFFALSVDALFQDWVKNLVDRKLPTHHYAYIPSKKAQKNVFPLDFKFSLDHSINQFYLYAHIEHDDEDPSLMKCEFIPNFQKVNNEKNRISQELHRFEIQQEKMRIQLMSMGHGKMSPIMQAQHSEIRKTMLEIAENIKDLQKKKDYWNTPSVYNVQFQFNPKTNDGKVEWVGASKYLFFGNNVPTEGFGVIVMNHIMALFDQWMDRSEIGKVRLEDASEKHVGGAVWDQFSNNNILRIYV